MNLKSILAILSVVVIFNSCKKEDLITNASMTAKIDGVSWSSITRVTVEKNGYFLITGTSVSGEIIEVTVFGNTASTYTLDPNQAAATCGAVYKPDATSTDSTFVSKSGKVILSKVDTKNNLISGTFNFVVTNLDLSKNITDGVFTDLSYNPEE